MDYSFQTYNTQAHYNHVSGHATFDGYWSGRTVHRRREDTEREIMKERIRAEILAEELERRRILEAEVRRELMLEHEMTSAVPSLLVLGKPMYTHQEFGPWAKIKTLNVKQSNDDKKEMIGLGQPSGSKRKAPPPSKKEDFSCRVCNICATSARDLKMHLSGKKHLAKVAPKSKNIKKKLKKKRKKH